MMQLRALSVGVVFALLTVLFGFGLGGVFGAFEDGLKRYLREQAAGVAAEVYAGDPGKRDKVVKKAWAYFKRAHLHGGGIGSAALAMILLLSQLRRRLRWRQLCSVALGLGGLGYATFWLAAGLRAPVLGSTGLAKEALSFWSIPSAGLLLSGTVLALALFVAEVAFGVGTKDAQQ